MGNQIDLKRQDIHLGSSSAEGLLLLMRSYQLPAILGAAAQLGIFDAIVDRPLPAQAIAERCQTNERATTVLLDALASVGLLEKRKETYQVPHQLVELLSSKSPTTIIPMLRHQEVCMRRWAQLAQVVRLGKPAHLNPSINGPEEDLRSFIMAMHVVSSPVADQLIAQVAPPKVRLILDIGCGPGTWTAAWLRRFPEARAYLFDLPEVLKITKQHLEQMGMLARVEFTPGNYLTDELPSGADVVWLSAVIHQHSRQENRLLFQKIRRALDKEATLLIRDIVMEPDRIHPQAGALFAVHMLVSTDRGGTYTFAEICEDLRTAGFNEVNLLRPDKGMHSVICARVK